MVSAACGIAGVGKCRSLHGGAIHLSRILNACCDGARRLIYVERVEAVCGENISGGKRRVVGARGDAFGVIREFVGAVGGDVEQYGLGAGIDVKGFRRNHCRAVRSVCRICDENGRRCKAYGTVRNRAGSGKCCEAAVDNERSVGDGDGLSHVSRRGDAVFTPGERRVFKESEEGRGGICSQNRVAVLSHDHLAFQVGRVKNETRSIGDF